MRTSLLSLLAVTAMLGCTPLASSGRVRSPVGAAPRTSDPLAGPWVVRDQGLRRSQVAEWRTLVTSQADSVVRVDTLRGELEVAWSSVPSTSPPRVAGLFSDHRVARGEDSLAPLPGLTLPFSFTAERRADGEQPAFVVPDGTACDSPIAAAAQSMRDLWMPLPDTLRPGLTWGDSTNYAICRDGLVLAVQTVRHFTSSAARVREGQLVVLVGRASRTRITGAGSQFGDSIVVSGDGEGSATLELSLAGGVIVAGEGASELRLDFRGSRRSQRVVQESRLVIREH